jgi:hypothetical protein
MAVWPSSPRKFSYAPPPARGTTASQKPRTQPMCAWSWLRSGHPPTMLAGAGGEQLAPGGDDVGAEEVVRGQPVLAQQPADAAPEREPRDAGRAHQTARGRQPEGLGLVIELAPREPGLGRRRARRRARRWPARGHARSAPPGRRQPRPRSGRSAPDGGRSCRSRRPGRRRSRRRQADSPAVASVAKVRSSLLYVSALQAKRNAHPRRCAPLAPRTRGPVAPSRSGCTRSEDPGD